MKLDERRKSTKLFRVYEEAYERAREALDDPELCSGYAMAVMLDEALNGSRRAKAKAPKEPLLFTGPELHAHLSRHSPETFIYQPTEPAWWARLNKSIREVDWGDRNSSNVLDAITNYVRSGAYGSWKKKTGLPFEYMVNNFKNWARAALAEDGRTIASEAGMTFLGAPQGR